MIMNGVSCFQLSLSFPELSNFEKFVKYANYEADNVIFTTQSYIKCLLCAFLVNPLLKRDQWKILTNNCTCDTSLFIINSFPMAARSFPVPCDLLAIFHNFLLKNKKNKTKPKNYKTKQTPPTPPKRNNKLREEVCLTYLYTCLIVNMGHYWPLSKGHVMEPT